MKWKIRIAVAAIVYWAGVSYAADEARKFACSGMLIEPTALASSPHDVEFTLASPKKVVIGKTMRRC
jgi:hypothetical protein